MKRQKKLFAVLLAGALLLSLAACGQTVQSSGGSQAAGSDGSQAVPADGLVTTAAGQVQGAEQDGVYQYREWFDSYFANGGADFDCIGLSYYPFWHGTMDDLAANLRDVGERYGKGLIVTETSMGFTMEDYKRYEGLSDQDRKGMATRPALVEKIGYPMTREGQRSFLRDLIALLRGTPHAAGYRPDYAVADETVPGERDGSAAAQLSVCGGGLLLGDSAPV